LDHRDLQDYIIRYESRLRQFGYSPETLGWGKEGRQKVRFSVLSHPILKFPSSSVLDVGCGFADLYDYLVAHGWHGHYCGIDIVPGLLQTARERHSSLDLREIDITCLDLPLETHDFLVASGVFNAKLKMGNNLRHTETALQNMFRLSRVAVCVDFMSTYVDYRCRDGWYTDPAWAFAFAKKVTRRVELRHDYMPFEFTLILYKDDSISESNVFNVTENVIQGGGLP
jgi:SAM-dependent methyltransferase